MTARTGMAELIEELRTLIGDASGAGATFTDAELQEFLDGNRTDWFNTPLQSIPTIEAGGVTIYKNYTASAPNWESSPVLQDYDYQTITLGTADVADLARGTWTFSSSQPPPVFVTGATYDLYGAATEALRAWIAKEKLTSFDFSADGADFKRSQRIKAMQDLIKEYSARAQAVFIQMVRGDQ